jgi:hypothetical protein
MKPCGGSFGVTPVLVDLHRVGVAGLGDALRRVDGMSLTEKEAIVDALEAALVEDNYVPETQRPAFRTALWREWVRFKGGDPTPFFSTIDVDVRGGAGDERERFVALVSSVLAGFELRPSIRFDPAPQAAAPIALVIGDETVYQGPPTDRRRLEHALRKSISGW